MPISIRRITPKGEKNQEIAWLCGDEWRLPPQIEMLEAWVQAEAERLPVGEYVADVGSCWRRDAAGGGSALDPASLKKLGEARITFFLSEYSGFGDDRNDDETEPPHAANPSGR